MPVGLLAEFNALAKETSPDKRIELLRRITDLYLSADQDCTRANRYLFGEIFSKVVANLARDQKLPISEDIAARPALPAEIAQQLASDPDGAIAGPILLNVDSLPDSLLIDVATTGSQGHLSAIAQRRTVSPPVTDVVVTRGNRAVLSHLAANAGASFSEYGMDTLIAKAEGDLDLQELIVGRADLSAAAVQKLMPLVSDSLSESLHHHGYAFDRASMRQHLADWMDDRRKNLTEVDDLIKLHERGDITLDSAVTRMLTTGRLLDAAAVISSAIKLDRRYAFNAMTHGPLQTALMLMRAAELSPMTAVEFVAQRQKKLKQHSPGDVSDVRHAYESIDPKVAQRVLRFYKVRQTVATS